MQVYIILNKSGIIEYVTNDGTLTLDISLANKFAKNIAEAIVYSWNLFTGNNPKYSMIRADLYIPQPGDFFEFIDNKTYLCCINNANNATTLYIGIDIETGHIGQFSSIEGTRKVVPDHVNKNGKIIFRLV
jgi:hypothetical protein